MAASNFTTNNYTSEKFVESCGAIMFDFSSASMKVSLINYLKKNEWLLPKGRRDCNEHRKDAAVREVREETGYACRLLPVTMPTRAPAPEESANVPDRPREYADIDDPFMVSLRGPEESSGIKLIWWYIAEVDGHGEGGDAEEGFTAKFFDCDEAMRTLTF